MATENEECSLSPRLSRALGAAFSEYHPLTVKETSFFFNHSLYLYICVRKVSYRCDIKDLLTPTKPTLVSFWALQTRTTSLNSV